MLESDFRPGDLVRTYALKCGWSIRKHNVIVEGENDQRYAILASNRYQEDTGLCLVGSDLAVFPPGIGDEGGTYGIQRQLPTLQGLVDVDFDEDGRRMFRFVALMDSDRAGKQAARALTGQHMKLRQNRDVFLLQREMPRETRDPNRLGRLIEQYNAPWKKLDCEIEDLLPFEMLDEFVKSNSNVLKRVTRGDNPQVENGRHHFEFDRAVKGRLCQYVEENALLCDLVTVVEMLKAMRFYLGLDPNGV